MVQYKYNIKYKLKYASTLPFVEAVGKMRRLVRLAHG